MQWYFQDGESSVGPLDDTEFHELISRGRIAPDTLVQREGEADWTPSRDAIRASKVMRYKEENASSQVDLSARVQGVDSRWVPGMTAGELRYASFGARFVAKIIDGLIQAAAILVVFGALFLLVLGMGENPNPVVVLPLIILGYVSAMILPIAYNAEFVARRGATPGKAAMGIKVTDSYGKTVSRGRAWGRAFAELISGMTMYIGYLLMLFDKESRTLHDLVCDTRVTRNL